MAQIVSHSITADIGLIRIDNPPVNALSQPVRQGLADALATLAAAPEARAIILYCSGRTFIAGADINEFNLPPREPLLATVLALLDTISKPVLAAIHGTALGGGLETALACHYRCALPSAKVGLPEVKLGILPGAGGTQRLPRAVPQGVALEMILTGAPIGAEAALRWGLVSHVIAGENLLDEALRIAKLIAANGPLAVRAARDAVYQGLALPLDQALRLEQFQAEPLRQSEDASEGVRAFVEKREPDFQGK